MEEALLAYLLADAGLTALVAARIGWTWRAQGAPLPALTLIVVDGPRDPLLAGGSSGFVEGYVQADCWGSYQLDAKQVARALVAALKGVNARSTGGVVQGAFVTHEHDSFEGESPTRLFRTMLTLRVPHAEP